SAAKIAVRAGSDMWGLDIRFRPAPMRRLRGVVLDAKGTPAANVPVKVAPIEETLADDSQTLSLEDGSFEFPLLYDGTWRVSAELPGSAAKIAAFALAQIAG